MQLHASDDQSVRCRTCGHEEARTGTFCSHCGARVATVERDSSSATDDGWAAPLAPPRRRARIVTGAVAAGLLVAGLIVHGVGGSDRAATPDDANPTEGRPADGGPEPDEVAAAPDVAPAPPTIGRWRGLDSDGSQARAHHGAVWSGRCRGGAVAGRQPCGEVIVWGGSSAGRFRDDIAGYDPLRERWRRIGSSAPIPSGPEGTPAGFWTGSELVLWGRGGPGAPAGIAIDTAEGRWRPLPEAPLDWRTAPAVAWTGTELFVWGGGRAGDGTALADGAILDLEAGTWRAVEPAPIAAREHATAATWRDRVVVWGGTDASGTALVDGALYDPGRDRWEVLPAPELAVSTVDDVRPAVALAGDTLVVVGSLERADGVPVAAALRLDTGRWRLIESPVGLRRDPSVAIAHSGLTPVVIVRGGEVIAPGTAPGGAVLYPITDSWRRIAPWIPSLEGQSATWTGREVVMWGGQDDAGEVGEGAAYRLTRTRHD